ncbi:MAG: hypothetical protein FH749_07790 [Firmicutes bacterium]|nr:hypothetical protein [Bacillota bacterium]
MLEFVLNWWGLLVLFIAGIVWAILDWQSLKKKIVSLIFVAEEQAQAKVLVSGKDKAVWVKKNGYKYMPGWLRFFISEDAFGAIVQKVFNELVKWAERQELSKEHS